MLLICRAKVALNCQRTRSGHTRSAGTKNCICPPCARFMISNPGSGEKSLEDILSKGKDNAPTKTNRRFPR
jgi:hypothetical protein